MKLKINSPLTATVINRQMDDLLDAWEDVKDCATKQSFMLMHNKLAILLMNMPVLQGVIEYNEFRRNNNDNTTATQDSYI